MPPGRVDYVDRDTARALAPEVYERHRAQRPGEISRSERCWDLEYGVLRFPSWKEPRPCFHVVARDPAGVAIGVARYECEEKWTGRQLHGQAVTTMLAARSYPVPGRLVVEVTDCAGPAGGRFALDAGPDGTHCVPSIASADLTLDAATLGSAYLGGYRVRTLAAAGLIDEHTPGAVERADAMFGSPVTPWCSTWF